MRTACCLLSASALLFGALAIGNPMLPALHGGVTAAFLEVAEAPDLQDPVHSQAVHQIQMEAPQDRFGFTFVVHLGLAFVLGVIGSTGSASA
jgi:hypothetical protein